MRPKAKVGDMMVVPTKIPTVPLMSMITMTMAMIAGDRLTHGVDVAGVLVTLGLLTVIDGDLLRSRPKTHLDIRIQATKTRSGSLAGETFASASLSFMPGGERTSKD